MKYGKKNIKITVKLQISRKSLKIINFGKRLSKQWYKILAISPIFSCFQNLSPSFKISFILSTFFSNSHAKYFEKFSWYFHSFQKIFFMILNYSFDRPYSNDLNDILIFIRLLHSKFGIFWKFSSTYFVILRPTLLMYLYLREKLLDV